MPKGGRTPTAIAKKTGAYRPGNHDGRLDADLDLQEVHRIEGLDPPEQIILDDLLSTMPEGVLSSMDTPLIQTCLDQHKMYRLAMAALWDDMFCARKRNAMATARDGYLKFARELGLTPNARAAMKAPVKTDVDDPFLDAIARQVK